MSFISAMIDPSASSALLPPQPKRPHKKKRSLSHRLTRAEITKPLGHEQEIDHYLAVSAGSLVAASVGALGVMPLTLLGASGLLYTTIPIWQSAYHSLKKERRFNMDCFDSVMLPVSLASGYVVAISISYAAYFIAKKLIFRAQHNSREQLVNIMGEQPRFVWVRAANGTEVEVAFETLTIGDVVIVDAGQTIAIDGVIVQGQATIDERMLTGESQPVEKRVGERVLASTIVLQGSVDIRVETAGDQTIAAQIGRVLQQTADYKSAFQLRGEEFGDQASLPLMLTGIVGFATVNPAAGLAIWQAPVSNTLRLSAPLGVLGYLQQGANQGILVKDGRSLELLREVDTVVFDKTGTLTEEQPNIGRIHLCGSLDEDDLLRLAAAAEQKQTHPIARSILAAAEQRGLMLPDVETAAYKMGFGLSVTIQQQVIQVGSQRFMALSDVAIPQAIEDVQQQCHHEGVALVYVAVDGVLAGAIELHPTIRPEVPEIINELRRRGLTTYIISGDREEPTRRMAERLGIDHYFAETLPEDKADLIGQLQAAGKKVCFVGDGINDSIALKKANVPVSLSGATNVATDTAQVILMDGSLRQLVALFDLSADLNHNMQRIILASAIPSAITIGGAFFFGLGLYAAIALYNLSLIAGVTNALIPTVRNQLMKRSAETSPAI